MSTGQILSPSAQLSVCNAAATPTTVRRCSPSEAALRLGLLLNELRFGAEVAWLTGVHDLERWATLWTEVRCRAREVLGVTEPQHRCQEVIVSKQQEWEGAVRNVDHCEQLTLENSALIAAVEHGRELPNFETESELFCRVAQSGSQPIEETRSMLERMMEESSKRLLCLGLHVDRAVRPLLTPRTVVFCAGSPPAVQIEGDVDNWTAAVRPRLSRRLPTEGPRLREDCRMKIGVGNFSTFVLGAGCPLSTFRRPKFPVQLATTTATLSLTRLLRSSLKQKATNVIV